jgi:hypothetical protein
VTTSSMINAATVGVHDHKIHIPRLGASSRLLIAKATAIAITNTSTEKIAAWLVSLSFVNKAYTPSSGKPLGRSCLAAGSRLGSWPSSRRRAGSCPAPSCGISLLATRRKHHTPVRGTVVSLKWAIFGVAWALLASSELLRTPLWRSSQKSCKAKIAQFTFYEVR